MSGEWEPSINQRVFIAALAKMVSPLQSADAVNAMIPMLSSPDIRHLPQAMFERPAELALEIGADMERVPSLARLRKALMAWHDAHKPKLAALPGVGNELPAADRAMVGFWNAYRDGNATLPSSVTLEMWLDTCRKPCPAGFAYICRSDLTAAEIAVKRGWMRERLTEHSPEEIAYAHERVVEAISAGRQTVDGYTGPSAVPPAQLPPPQESTPSVESSRLPKPEHVQAHRMANPLLKPIAERAQAISEAPAKIDWNSLVAAQKQPLPPIEWPEDA
jgi:hypothetical protein